MKPILYPAGETQFQNNGLGRLSDMVKCLVTEERNGQYELEMQYPITGIHYKDITEVTISSQLSFLFRAITKLFRENTACCCAINLSSVINTVLHCAITYLRRDNTAPQSRNDTIFLAEKGQ